MKNKNFKNILVVSLSNLGDVILTLPVVNVLKGNFPEAKLSLVVGPKARSLFYPSDYFHEVYYYDKKARLAERFQFLQSLWRAERFDLVIDLRNTLIPFLVLAKQFNSPLKVKTKKKINMKRKHLKALEFLNLDFEKTQPYPLFLEEHVRSLEIKMKEMDLSLEDLRGGIAVSPGARYLFKTWPVEKFTQLCKVLLEGNPSKKIFLTGTLDEKEVTRQIQGVLGGGVIELAGNLSVPELACLIGEVKLLISNDSAAMHIANYGKKPVVSIFGPTDPEKYGEFSDTSKVVFNQTLSCRPCEKAVCPTERECLNELPTEIVYSQVQQLLLGQKIVKK